MTEGRSRVLIVEDEPDMNNLLAEVLSAYGFEPVQAKSGEEALALLADLTPDAFIVDLMLPGLSGYELCHRLKTDRATSALPVVILTALDRADDRRQGYATGADDYVTKPFNPEGLVSRLRACLERNREVREDAHRLTASLEFAASAASLKHVNTLATALYCWTDMASAQVETLRSGLNRLADAAEAWAARHKGLSPVRLRIDLDRERLRLAFEAETEDATAFLAEHLDAESAVPAGFVDAGLIDRRTAEGKAVILEKTLPPDD